MSPPTNGVFLLRHHVKVMTSSEWPIYAQQLDQFVELPGVTRRDLVVKGSIGNPLPWYPPYYYNDYGQLMVRQTSFDDPSSKYMNVRPANLFDPVFNSMPIKVVRTWRG
jgi:hypothetical protein